MPEEHKNLRPIRGAKALLEAKTKECQALSEQNSHLMQSVLLTRIQLSDAQSALLAYQKRDFQAELNRQQQLAAQNNLGEIVEGENAGKS